MPTMGNLVLMRHGESVWNKENRFTGWTDVNLSENGIAEAQRAGQLLQANGYTFDVAHTSVLKRAIRTLHLVQTELDLLWIPTYHSWRLNERHYGALQSLNKAETALQYGDEQVREWRRSYDVRPPALDTADPRFPGSDPRYHGLDPKDIPRTECLKDTVERVLPYWQEAIAPALKAGKRVIIAAHGNSLRGLIKYLDHMDDEAITNLEIPTGAPLVYELDENLTPIQHFYLS